MVAAMRTTSRQCHCDACRVTRQRVRRVLYPADIAHAEVIARARMQETVTEWGYMPAHGATAHSDRALQLHILGAQGEVVIANYLGYTAEKGIFGGTDVGPYQVRTRSNIYYDLILHASDADDAVFILVLGPIDRPRPKGTLCFLVAGWCEGAAGKNRLYWNDPAGGRPAYFVPQRVLRPMQELPEVRELQRVRQESKR